MATVALGRSQLSSLRSYMRLVKLELHGVGQCSVIIQIPKLPRSCS